VAAGPSSELQKITGQADLNTENELQNIPQFGRTTSKFGASSYVCTLLKAPTFVWITKHYAHVVTRRTTFERPR